MSMVQPDCERRTRGSGAPRQVQRTWRRRALRLACLGFLAGLAICATARAQEATHAPHIEGATTQPTETPTTQPGTAPGGSVITTGLNSSGAVALNAGQSSVVGTGSACRVVSIANPDVADFVQIAPSQILITGKKPGTTQLVVWDTAEHSQVVDVTVNPNMRSLQDELKRLFPEVKGVEATSANGAVVLRGHVPDFQTATRMAEVAQPYGTKVLNFLEVSGGQQVMLKVRFAEVSRSVTQNLGFNAFASDGRFKAGINNGPGDNPVGGLITSTASSSSSTTLPPVSVFGAGQVGDTAFEFFLDALRQNNLLRVLAEPDLTTINGKRASFLAGGEFPIPVPQTSGSGGTAITVEYKEFGVKLNFTPTVLGDGKIRLEVSPEVSDLDFTQSVSFGGFVIPSITSRTVNTTVELSEGQTLALAGLLNNRVTANKSVTPLLGDIPILGALFRSVRYTRNETELVVLVTPRLVAPMNPGQVPPLPGEHWRYPDEAELFLGADLGGPAPDAEHAPSMRPPPQFHGRYGFTPVEPTALQK